MFSDHFFKSQYFWITWVACTVGAVSYKLDPKRKRFYTTLKAQRRCSHVWMALAGQNLFLIVMMIYTKKNQNFNAFNHAYLGWVISSVWCICLGVNAFYAELVVCVLNGYFVFFERYKRMFMPDYNPNKCPINHRIDFTCVVMRWSSLLLGFFQFLHSFLNSRKSPFFIDYYIPDEYYTPPVFICTTIIHLSMAILSAAIIGLSSLMTFAFFTHLNYIITNDIRCCRRGSYRTSESLRTGHNMRITYRSLELLHNLDMEICGVILYPLNWLMLKMVIFCGANLIKYHQYMKPLVRHLVAGWAITGLISWSMTLEMCGYMFQYSQRVITSWKYHEWGDDRKVMSKFKKACKPMIFGYHKVFRIKRISVLKFFRSVAKSMFKAFVAL